MDVPPPARLSAFLSLLAFLRASFSSGVSLALQGQQQITMSTVEHDCAQNKYSSYQENHAGRLALLEPGLRGKATV